MKLSFKNLAIAFVVAEILLVVFNQATGMDRKNSGWIMLWIYLSLESWKVWRWCAFVPYPLFIVVSFIVQMILLSSGMERFPLVFLSVTVVLNIGGLIIFYMMLRKAYQDYIPPDVLCPRCKVVALSLTEPCEVCGYQASPEDVERLRLWRGKR